MNNKRFWFIAVAYVLVALLLNYMGVTGWAYFIALVVIAIIAYSIYPLKKIEGKEDAPHGRDPSDEEETKNRP